VKQQNIRDVNFGETSKLLIRRYDGTDDICEINLTKKDCINSWSTSVILREPHLYNFLACH
jgi:uncharacterized Fe-S cluster-containing MiaB family protein